MIKATARLVSTSPYSQSKHYEDPKLPKELHDAYEVRTWRSRMHVTKDGHVEIPGPSFAIALKNSAKRLKLQVPGKGRVEWTKYFEAGIMCLDGIRLPQLAKEVPFDRLFVPSDGRRGGGKRVTKYFPRIDSWEGDVTYWVFDDMITRDVFEQVLSASGIIVGIGRFRPENCGFYGRFGVKSLTWKEADAEDMAAE